MKRCAPIKSRETINLIKEAYRAKKQEKDLLLFLLSINPGLNIVDLLKLTVKDVKNKTGLVVHQDGLHNRIIPFDEEVSTLIEYVTKDLKLSSLLFISCRNMAMDRVTVSVHFKVICNELGLDESISAGSWRKIFGYFHYQKYQDFAYLNWLFGHASMLQTVEYIDIDDVNFATQYQEGLGL